jgi:hypothetical protein
MALLRSEVTASSQGADIISSALSGSRENYDLLLRKIEFLGEEAVRAKNVIL